MERPDGNLYAKAIHHPDHHAQLQAFMHWSMEEVEQQYERLTDLENDDGSIPDENKGQWNYEKGRLDALRLVHGMFAQAVLSHGAYEEVEADADRP